MKTTSILLLLFVLVASIARAGNGSQGYTFVVTTDFSTGSSSCVDRVARTSTNNVEPVHSDAVARAFDNYVYVVNRSGGDNIQILDPANGFNTLHQFSTGNGSNPHDVVVRPGNVAYVTRYDMTSVLKMNLANGATLATISLASFADADGFPEMDQMFVHNNLLFVLLQRLDRNNFYTPVGTSYAAVIDMNTDTLVDMDPGAGGVQPVVLIRTNPYSEVVWQGANVWFSAVGFFGVQDGGLLAFSPASPSSQTVVLTESAAGGDILDAVRVSATKGYAIVANAAFQTVLIEFNPSTGTKTGATIYNPGGYDLSDIEFGTDLLVADRKVTNPGVRFFDTSTNTQLTANPLNVGLPPFDILEHLTAPTSAGDAPLAASLGQNYPNPFNPETAIPFSLAADGRVSLHVYDVSGRLVTTLLDEYRDAGSHDVRWDGRNSRGTPVPSGVYFYRLRTPRESLTRKLVVIK